MAVGYIIEVPLKATNGKLISTPFSKYFPMEDNLYYGLHCEVIIKLTLELISKILPEIRDNEDFQYSNKKRKQTQLSIFDTKKIQIL